MAWLRLVLRIDWRAEAQCEFVSRYEEKVDEGVRHRGLRAHLYMELYRSPLWKTKNERQRPPRETSPPLGWAE